MSTSLLALRVWFFTVVFTVVASLLVLLFQAGSYRSWDAIGGVFFLLIEFTRTLAGTTIAALLLSLYINRKSFAKTVGAATTETTAPSSKATSRWPSGDVEKPTA